MNLLKATSRWHFASLTLLAFAFIAAGVNHFVSPHVYRKIMPGYLPWPMALIYVSGFFEILGGVGVAVPKLRRAAGWGLIALLVAVFPANVDMWMQADEFPSLPTWALFLRLPFQGVLMAWVWWATIKTTTRRKEDP
jgi:uncharacterized membrane protein